MRGKEERVKEETEENGITPAHAGKSGVSCEIVDRCWDHPRTCGEKFCHSLQDRPYQGSPPHMRGKVNKIILNFSCLRITPAHAGKRLLRLWLMQCVQDHPRTCGEKALIDTEHGRAKGSPPHMRGKVKLL